eukprot:6459466-Prymnesium_polylepis.1
MAAILRRVLSARPLFSSLPCSLFSSLPCSRPLSTPALARERRLLRGVLHEALQQHASRRHALEREQHRVTAVDTSGCAPGSSKSVAKALRRRELVPLKLAE